ncbi:myeloid leukemia factor 2-like [Acanthaster planci]|uniref:Myeloid leukemia factor 2-like n=1 Tax=Acanthaster planci TaxID=133434 RepID=A0A8B7Z9L6_ACAPL|nr:myeloid leukemia factor 2-like [Acanthaster planci]XP_022099946.1 myeloid leukemia factor 2-like [Acanthaster planci]XP_022099947.1 myeloid leukemia factor 2-like [Acanthaster planci]
MMFGSMFRDFDEDPFFSDMHDMHRRHMQRMQPVFSPSFGFSPFMALEGGRGQDHFDGTGRAHRNYDRQALQPFGMEEPFGMGFGNMFSNMQTMMANMHRNFENMANSPDVHSFSHSSFTSYSSDGNGAPKVYQATSSTRKAPGGVKETRRSVRDSEVGLERMAVGHHLGDRAHVVERSRNSRTGQMEQKQDFTNLDETEADAFNSEWRERTQRYNRHHAVSGRHRQSTPAITSGRENYTSVQRDRSPSRPTGPSKGGRHRSRDHD